MRRAFAFLGLVVAAPIALLGLFSILYQGDTPGSDVYVDIGGTHVDADVVGLVLLAIASAIVFLSLRSLRRSGVP